MDRFITEVARHYYEAYGRDVGTRTFVFPSRRAILFFERALGEIAETPLLAPRCLTISDFLASLAPEMMVLDRTALLFELYACYKAEREAQTQARGVPQTGSGGLTESFDEFLFWGNIILSDFDLIDRHLIDASLLYRNLGHIKELRDELTDLDDETLDLLERFWDNFTNPHKLTDTQRQEHRQRFMDFWLSLAGVYERLTSRLREEGLAYEGMLYRHIAEHSVSLVSDLIERGHGPYVFVGLFEITPSEMKILSQMRSRGLAEMYWDEAVAIVQDPEHPAHRLMASNISRLGRANAPLSLSPQELLPREVKVYRSSSTISQVKALGAVMKTLGVDLLQEHDPKGIDTAIVLPSQQLLLPVASAIPESFRHLNITLGYPLSRTPIAIFVHRWLRLVASYTRGAYPLERVESVVSLQVLGDSFPLLSELSTSIRAHKRYMISTSRLTRLIDELASPGEAIGADAELAETQAMARLLLAHYDSGREVLGALSSLLEHLSGRMLREAQRSVEPSPVETSPASPSSGGAPPQDEGEALERVPMSFDLEFVYHYRRLVTRLSGLMDRYAEWAISVESMARLLDGLTLGVSIPFEGNPLQGLQIMGLLESRLLHFDTIIYLSAQEGSLPARRNLSTLIPATLRAGYHLPSLEWLDTADAYRFYQSVARSKRLVMLYGSEDPIGGGRGEESRYLRQMRMLYQVEVEEVGIQTLFRPSEPCPIVIDKRTPQVQTVLSSFLRQGEGARALSASALADYKACSLRFYYKHILRITDEGRSVQQLLGSGDFGTLLHNTMKELYDRAHPSPSGRGREITRPYIAQLLTPGNKAIEREVIRQYQMLFAPSERAPRALERSDLDALVVYYIDLLVEYIKKVLRYDLGTTPFDFVGGEQFVSTTFPLEGDVRVNLKGTIDRLDLCRGVYDDGRVCLRILDYKTGSDRLRPIASMGKLVGEYNPQDKAVIQTLLYCELVRSAGLEGLVEELEADLPLVPGVLIIRRMLGNLEDYSPYLYERGASAPLAYSSEVREAFVQALRGLLMEVFDLERPFEQTTSAQACQYCPFARICGV